MTDLTSYRVTLWRNGRSGDVWVDAHTPAAAAECALDNPPQGFLAPETAVAIVQAFRDCPMCDGSGRLTAGASEINPQRESQS